jgi:hypothetical protein
MNVTRDVVTDLLPLYLSGDASVDSRALVEEFFRSDPEYEGMARKVREVRAMLNVQVPAPDRAAEAEKKSLKKTREMLGARNAWLGFAIAYTLAPLFTFRYHGAWWIMFRDNPLQAALFVFIGGLCWVAYLVYRRRLRLTGL